MTHRDRAGDPSGHGSDIIQTETIRRELPILFKELKIRTLLDIPCGDFFWMKEMPLGNIEYLGGDIVDDLIRANDKFTTDEIQFKRLNLIESPLPEMDLIFVRDCLVHLTNKDITRSLQNMASSPAVARFA